LAENKQHTEAFENCLQEVVKQGHEKGSAFAICTKSFQDAGKPVYVGEAENQKLHLFSESIKLDGNKVSGVAIHPKRIFHPDEGLTHVYLRDELEKAAPTLVGKPFGIDHLYVLPPPNVITNAWYDTKENGVAFEGLVDDKIAEQIRNKAFKGLSIELDWLKPGGKVEYANGVAPRNFELTSCHLLRNFPPGDPEAYIRLFEQLVAGPPLPLDQRVEAVERQIQEILNQINVINGKLDVLTSHHSPSAIGESAQPEPSQTKEEMIENKPKEEAVQNPSQIKEAQWTTEYVNNLDDSAFAAIEAGGEKDEQGKTTPRSLRHLEHHNAEGNVDEVHVKAALQRLNQTKISDALKAEAKKHLCGHAKQMDFVSEVCGEEPPKVTESEDAVALRKKIVDLEAKLAESEKTLKQQTQVLQKKHADFRKMIESTIPPSHIWKAWTPGPQKLIQAQLKVLRESQS